MAVVPIVPYLRSIKINPAYLLAILTILAIGAAILERGVQDRRTAVIGARDAYVAALTSTRTQLAGLLDKVANDRSLTHNLTMKLQHSAKSTLDAHLQAGALDQLALTNAACEPISKSAYERYIPVKCPDNKNASSQFFWFEHEGIPALALFRSLPESAGDDLYLLGVVQLSSYWLANQIDLAPAFASLSIEINGKGTVLHNEGELSDKSFSASLTSTSLLDRLLISKIGKDLAYGNPVLIPCLILILITCIFVIAREQTTKHRVIQSGNDLIVWAKSVSPIGGFTAPGKAPIVATGIPSVDLATAKMLVTKALEVKNEQIYKVNQRREAIESRVKGLNEDILSLQKRLSELAELDSLAIQLGNTSESFLQHVQEMNLNSEDISDIVGTEIAERGAILHNMLMEWQEGVETRGARKFIRTLSETPGIGKGSTLLDDQIITIATVAGEISDLAINASILAHKIAEVSSYSARIAGLWRGIALKTNADKACANLLPVIEDAQELIAQNRKYRNVSFQNLLTENEKIAIPEIPVSLWQSALFQVYASVAEISSSKPARIVTKLRSDGTKSMLVVQIIATEGHPLPQRTQRQTYLLEVAKSVLTPFAVNVSALPALEGPFPVALSWQSVGLSDTAQTGSTEIPLLTAANVELT